MLGEFLSQPIDEYSHAKRKLSPMRIEKRYGRGRRPVLRKNFNKRARRQICGNVVVRNLYETKS
jgi:hypothetical protein